MASPFEGMVETSVGATFVRVVGQGPMVFVLHGGPGFDHTYLWSSLNALSRRRTLIFYDQVGCGRSDNSRTQATKAMILKQFVELREKLAGKSPAGVFAHSWGAVVAVASISEGGMLPFTEGVFITPMPLTSAAFEMCRNNLFSRIPARNED